MTWCTSPCTEGHTPHVTVISLFFFSLRGPETLGSFVGVFHATDKSNNVTERFAFSLVQLFKLYSIHFVIL